MLNRPTCIATNQAPDTVSNPNHNPDPNSKQLAVVTISIQLHIHVVACSTYTEKFIRDNVVAPFLLLHVVIVTPPAGYNSISTDLFFHVLLSEFQVVVLSSFVAAWFLFCFLCVSSLMQFLSSVSFNYNSLDKRNVRRVSDKPIINKKVR